MGVVFRSWESIFPEMTFSTASTFEFTGDARRYRAESGGMMGLDASISVREYFICNLDTLVTNEDRWPRHQLTNLVSALPTE